MRFSELFVDNAILFEIKTFGRKNKATMLARYLIKITSRPTFT